MSKPRRVGRRMLRQRNGNMRRKYARECGRAQEWADGAGYPVNVYRIPHEAHNEHSGQGYRADLWGRTPFFPVLYCAMTVHSQAEVTHD